ncbi:uncharacterized protein UV8b_01070 [Ustilaginoidea virens]|uniref:E3 ubiquitin-protein ligase listerin n=1 Tax=Ustilaginoidea virens TaxID=1159556 RepID=A0A063C3L6_USTVR|nr:uncharacterized protein UV8b_01070 [Ustilaginoidea virens]QUC16829.1 hypothetical protein UV8b_01070 [Ustilaginoidea virens]GAO16805.1 hypothetical protein UVI_02053460 [Ustilaginoidea virens]
MKRGPRGLGSAPGAAFGFSGASSDSSSLTYLAEPPSFTALSDPNVVVSLKNVLKKDSTTKAKGLEHLIHYALSHPFEQDGGVEEPLLHVWTRIYARISIDNSRRVRELSHALQLELLRSARKRMEPHIPKVVGPWIAGIYDRDRAVAKAANDGLLFFLTTPEKSAAFWSRCQAQILDFAIEAIRETKDTLSDERSTSAQDAETKYFRVVISSLSLVMGLLQRVDQASMDKFGAKYDEYFEQEAVWKSITSSDSGVRKTACHLLFACLDRRLPYGLSTKARQALVTGGLKTSQSGSALEYVRALTKLTQQDASIWTSPSNDRKSPLARLQAFISKGSQGSPSKYWEVLDELLTLIPADTLGLEAASKLASSVKTGITNREEPRTNAPYSWKCFINVAQRSLSQLPDNATLAFAREHLFPLLEQFLFPTSEGIGIHISPNAMSVLVEAHSAAIHSSSDVVQASADEWDRLGGILCANTTASLPEVSKEYKSSQEAIAEQGRRWFALVGEIFANPATHGPDLTDQTAAPSQRVISQCLSLLENRNMKPFGAAQILEYALSTSPHLFTGDSGRRLGVFMLGVADCGLERVATSASAKPLLSSLRIFGSMVGRHEEYQKVWGAWAEETLKLADGQVRNATLAGLLSQEEAAPFAMANQSLQDTLYALALATVARESQAWSLLNTALTHGALRSDMCGKLANELVARLSKSKSHAESVLRMLGIVAEANPGILSSDPVRTELVAQLLHLSELHDSSISPRVATIRALLDGQAHGRLPIVAIIRSNLERAAQQSLSLQTLVSQAKSAVESGAASWEDVLPNTNIWMEHLTPLLNAPINPSLSITSSLGGAISLHTSTGDEGVPLSCPRDSDGRSIPVRMALYTSQLVRNSSDVLSLPRQFQIELLYSQCLAVQLASDQIACDSRNGLWLTLAHADSFFEVEQLVTASRVLLEDFISKASDWSSAQYAGNDPPSVVQGLVELAVKEAGELSPRGVYSARVLSELLQALVNAHGMPKTVEERFLKLENLKATSETTLSAAGLVAGLGEAAQSSAAVSNFCNRLVSEVAAAASPEDPKVERLLVLLPLVAQTYQSTELPVAKNRVVFAVRQITSWLEDDSALDDNLCASICRVLNSLLPCMKDVYGSYWEIVLRFCGQLWERAALSDVDTALPSIHASVKLARTLEGIPEPNDDLEDALKDFSPAKSRGLIELLRIERRSTSRPLEIVDGMLCREVEKLPVSSIPKPEQLFSLVASESHAVQTAAFGLLHRKIPAEQGQRSIDVLLDKTTARLPDELVSLLLDPPTLEAFPDELLSTFPSSIRGYLLSWKLVFSAYSSSSFKVREDYTEHLKTEQLVPPLLDFMFDVLGHSAAHPLNLDKENLSVREICDYDVKLAEAETEEHSFHWLLVHLYYLTLRFIPSLFRAWCINCRSKQTRIAVESWTTKYFSPIIIKETLDGVEKWAQEQEAPAHDERNLVVKVSRPAKEVTAGYEIDESQATVSVKIPPSYPIEGVVVSSLNRIAVPDRTWQSWIMSMQGSITLYNGSIIDGLQVFKNNVVAALAGKSECAICYSIISSDKRMPDKACGTCNQLFHRTCLYRWFQSSNQNTCPLCRNPIGYLGADTAKRRQG